VLDYYRLAGPLVRAFDPERAHRLGILALRSGLLPRPRAGADPVLATTVWSLRFPSPVGLAAGFDKNAEAVDPLLAQGFGFVEVGTVTPEPQAGNPRPRLFRLPEDRAVINRMGFNNDGAVAVAARLARRRDGVAGSGAAAGGIVGGNVGPNRDDPDPAAGCARAVRALAPHVDYLVVNVSSPNTPGLRGLQGRARLADLLARVRDARDSCGTPRPLLVKVAPDLTAEERADIAEVVMASGIDGLIATNTTVARPPDLLGRHRRETGGLSGRPLFVPSTEVLADFRRLTRGRLPLIGVGGIAGGADAYAKIRAGASLVQLYTALVYGGPALVGRIAGELAALLRRDGFAQLADAVGADVDGPREETAEPASAP